MGSMSEINSPLDDLPLRRSSRRLVILDPSWRLLLFRYNDQRPGSPFWSTVGGALRGGEDYLTAAERELHEETGFSAAIGPLLRTREDVFAVARSGPARWIEHYFLVESEGGEVDNSNWSDEERVTIQEWRWWTLEEMQETGDRFLPEWLPHLLEDALNELRGKTTE